jgi:hypothetical protein
MRLLLPLLPSLSMMSTTLLHLALLLPRAM